MNNVERVKKSRKRRVASLKEERKDTRVSVAEAKAAVQEMEVQEREQENWVNVDTSHDDDEDVQLALAMSASIETTLVNNSIVSPPTTEDESSREARNRSQPKRRVQYIRDPKAFMGEDGEEEVVRRRAAIDYLKDRFLKRKAQMLRRDVREQKNARILRCYKVCRQEQKAAKIVSAADPIDRTANYLGLSIDTVEEILASFTDERSRKQ
ncbi:hypothetical protein BGZ83_001723 [Gryganskiella cystojenkinii]|nr:hypothetical protein BGZ83_001723 [Gryganskiella cystojenkinii]